MYEEAINILKIIENKGYKAYIVGGYPRDKFLGIKSTDIDICTNMKPDVIKENFLVITDNSKFGSFVIKTKYEYEITTFRTDLYANNRFPLIMFTDELKSDLRRRDFIINTLCIDSSGEYVDLLGAIKDLEDKVINTVGDADKKFKEDPLRIFRAIRFSLDLNFSLSNDIIESIKKNSYLISRISKNRLNKELNKFKNKKKGLEIIQGFGLKIGE